MPVQVADKVYWVGAVDWNVRDFHGYTYTAPRGTTYNAYLVLGDEVALVDTVAHGFEEEMMGRIRELVDPARIRHLIANHGESDHSAAIPYVLAQAPQAKLYCTRKGTESLGAYFPQLKDFQVVRTGDTLPLGGKTLSFIEAPMLHWPDSMFTYLPEDRLLLPNDAFGQHLATSQRFADEVEAWQLWDEAERYYANILAPFSRLVLRKLDEVAASGLAIDTIAPSHGVIWRRNPGQILEAYRRWASSEARERVIIAYETMWGSTEKLARALAEGVAEEGVEALVRGLPMADRTDVVKELLEAKGLLVGSSTHNQRALLNIAAFMEDLKGLRFTRKLGAAFGSHGWGGGAVAQLEEGLREAGFDVMPSELAVRWAPSEEDLARAREFGRRFAREVRQAVDGPALAHHDTEA
jgi:anaerobic nitric oxide reductase flavorubredoxin